MCPTLEVDVEALYTYFNLTSASMRLMNIKFPQRGGKEKDCESMEIVIKALTTHVSIVLDVYAFICY